MTSRIYPTILAMLVPILAFSCGVGKPPPRYVAGKRDGTAPSTENGIPGTSSGSTKVPVAAKNALKFKSGDLVSDPVNFSFGVMKLNVIDQDSKPIAVSNYIYVDKPQTLDPTAKTELESLCRNVGLSSRGDEMSQATDTGSASKPLYLMWRSFFKNSVRDSLTKILLADQTNVLCVMKVVLTEQTDKAPYYLSFDPVVTAKSVVFGTFDSKEVAANGLMLPIEWNASLKVENLIPVKAVGEFKLNVSALKKASVTASPEELKPTVCLLSAATEKTVLNPSALITPKIKLASASPFQMGKISAQAVDGRTLKSCGLVKTAVAEQEVSLEHTCKNYQDVKDEGLEAGCQWNIELSNKADPENDLALRVALPKTELKVINLMAVDSALTKLPQSPDNPVRTKEVKFTGFNAIQLKSMEQVFDVWIATERKSFDTDVDGFMREILLSQCDAGVLGFAQLRSARLNMCLGAKLSDSAVTKANDPHRLILQLITASHEVRHAVKWSHDFDNKSYTPCEATAASASTMHAILSTCQEEYCFVMRSAAKREYIAELRYSLQGDNRRFEGQCKKWSDDIGITNGEL